MREDIGFICSLFTLYFRKRGEGGRQVPGASSCLVAAPCVARMVFGGRVGGCFTLTSSRAAWRETDCVGGRAKGGQRKKAEQCKKSA